MRIHNERLSLIYVSLAMVTVGMLIAETGASLDLLVRQLDLTAQQQGSIISARFLGGVAFGLFLWIRSTTIPLGRWFQGSLILTVATAPLLLMDTYLSAYVAALLRGFTAGFVIPAAGMYATSQGRWSVGMISGVVNAALSGGLVLISVAAFAISQGSLARWEIYWGMAPLVAGITLLIGYLGGSAISPSDRPGTEVVQVGTVHAETARTDESKRTVAEGRSIDPGESAHRETAPSGGSVSLLAGVRQLLAGTSAPFAIAAFFVVGTESILFGLMPRLSALLAAERALSSDSGWIWSTEQYALAVMAGVFVGRVAGSFILRIVRPGAVLIASVVLLLAFGAVWIFAPPALIALSALGFGLATANFFPALVGAVAVALGRGAPTTIAAMGWTGAGGGTLVPPIAALVLAAGLPYPLMGIAAPLPSTVAVVLSVAALHRSSTGRRDSGERDAPSG
jgi:MFS family permease